MTLVEIMISITLSLVFVAGAMSFLFSSYTMQDVQESSSLTQENARFVLDELTPTIRMAGYYNLMTTGNNAPAGQFYTGACGSFAQCTGDAVSANGSPRDRIAILINPPEDDGTDGDCGGNPISTSTQVAMTSVVAHQYRIEVVDDENSLVCDTYIISDNNATRANGSTYTLVQGVDALQILYGITDIRNINDTNNRIARYLPASAISALPAPTGASSAWVDIAAVRVSFLVGSGTRNSSASSNSQTYTLLDSSAFTINDRRFRKVYTSTIQINNSRL